MRDPSHLILANRIEHAPTMRRTPRDRRAPTHLQRVVFNFVPTAKLGRIFGSFNHWSMTAKIKARNTRQASPFGLDRNCKNLFPWLPPVICSSGFRAAIQHCRPCLGARAHELGRRPGRHRKGEHAGRRHGPIDSILACLPDI